MEIQSIGNKNEKQNWAAEQLIDKIVSYVF